jgi:hypothetical protein
MLKGQREDGEDGNGGTDENRRGNEPPANPGAGGASLPESQRLARAASPRLGEAKRRLPA